MYNQLLASLSNVGLTTYLLVFFTAALLSLGSCTVVRIPIILGYIGGLTKTRKQSLFILIGVITGLILSYTVIGVLFGKAAGFVVKSVKSSFYFYRTAGIILLISGFYIVGFFPRLSKSIGCKISNLPNKKLSFLGAVFFGITFALLEAPVCPCCGPVLLLIATKVIASGSFIYALTIFITYAVGQSFPLLIVGISAGALRFAHNLHRFEPYIKVVAGVVLFYFGVYLIWLA